MAQFLQQNQQVQNIAGQLQGFQPTQVGMPNAAQLRLRDVLLSGGTSSPYVGAATDAGTRAAMGSLPGYAPRPIGSTSGLETEIRENVGRNALTGMFPVVSKLALGGAQQELGRYRGIAEATRGADTLRLGGLEGAGQLASRATQLGTMGRRVEAGRVGAGVGTPVEKLLADRALANAVQNMNQTQLSNTPRGMYVSTGATQDWINSYANALQQSQTGITAINQALAGYGYTGAQPGGGATLRNYYGG